ncbi:hypothetical protein KGQ27_02550 [Patescibacteria group bacterium]|nr:hypothetical protein [Patescibacteria group bacterium]MDE1946447.1 hypothetical protein [Patescibacteria group bacterium]MDE2011055.1 hypothetical protein [Patescibacteria group bacterium]MDE2233534.1 hypothetical protein [Patescibacteria group bacterium]
MKTIHETDFYRTSDLACAAAISLFVRLDNIDKTDRRRAFFIFERNSELDGLLESFWKGTLTVEPRAYFDQIKALKTRLYEID